MNATPFGYYRWDGRLYHAVDWADVRRWDPAARRWEAAPGDPGYYISAFVDPGYEMITRVPDADAEAEATAP